MADIKYEWVFNNLYNKKVLKAVKIKKNIKNVSNNQLNKTNFKTSPVINWMIECGDDCESNYRLTNDNKLTVIHSGTNRIVSSTIFKINEEEKKDCYYLGLQLDLSKIPNPGDMTPEQDIIGALNATMFFISPYYLGSDVYSYCAAPGGLGSCMDTIQKPNNVLPNSYGQCPEIDLMESVGRDIIQFTGHNASIVPQITFIINDDEINNKKNNNIKSSYFGRKFQANIKNLVYDANIQKLFDDFNNSLNTKKPLKAILNRKDEFTYHILPIDSITSKGKGSNDTLENIQFKYKNRPYRFPYFNLNNNFVNRNSCDFTGPKDAKLYIGDKNNAKITYNDASGQPITLVDFKPFDSSGNTIFIHDPSDPPIPNTNNQTYKISKLILFNKKDGVTCNNFNCPESTVTYYLQLDNGPFDTKTKDNMNSNEVFESLNCLSITITDIDYFDIPKPNYMTTVPPFDDDLIQKYYQRVGKSIDEIKSTIANRPCYGRDSFCSTAMFTAKATKGDRCNVTKIMTTDGNVDAINGDPHAGFVFIGYKDNGVIKSLDTTKPFNLYIHFNFKESKILFNYRQTQGSFKFNHTIDVTQNLTDQGVYGGGDSIKLNQPWRYSTKITMSYFKKYFERGCNLVVGYNDNYLGPKGYFGNSNFACSKFNNNLGLNPEFSVKIIDTNFDISTKVDVNNSNKCLAFTNSGSRATNCSKCKDAIVNS